MQCPFLCFVTMSGLKKNLSNSEIVHVGDADDVEGLASILGCRVASFADEVFEFSFGRFLQDF
jgi:hypothetical protein